MHIAHTYSHTIPHKPSQLWPLTSIHTLDRMKNFFLKLLILTIPCILAIPRPLKSFTPRLTNMQFDEHAFRFQADEFGMHWDRAWASFYDTEDEFREFMSYFFENACTQPQQIAIEPSPHEMLVCAHTCPLGSAAVLKVFNSGKRKRTCSKTVF